MSAPALQDKASVIARLRNEMAEVIRAMCTGKVINRASLARQARDLDERIRALETERSTP